MTQREAAPILLRLLASGPKTQTEVRVALPARNPTFVCELLTVAQARGDVRYNRRTDRWELAK